MAETWRNAASDLHTALDMGDDIPALDLLVTHIEGLEEERAAVVARAKKAEAALEEHAERFGYCHGCAVELSEEPGDRPTSASCFDCSSEHRSRLDAVRALPAWLRELFSRRSDPECAWCGNAGPHDWSCPVATALRRADELAVALGGGTGKVAARERRASMSDLAKLAEMVEAMSRGQWCTGAPEDPSAVFGHYESSDKRSASTRMVFTDATPENAHGIASLRNCAPELIAEALAGRALESCTDHADACCNDWCAACQRSQAAEVEHTRAVAAVDAKLAEGAGE